MKKFQELAAEYLLQRDRFESAEREESSARRRKEEAAQQKEKAAEALRSYAGKEGSILIAVKENRAVVVTCGLDQQIAIHVQEVTHIPTPHMLRQVADL